MSTSDQAMTEFLRTKAQIEEKLERLTAHAAEHFERNPENINYGDVGDLQKVNYELLELMTFLNIK